MDWAEVGAAAGDHYSFDDAFTSRLLAFFAGELVNFMVLLKFPGSAQKIAIIRHRIPAEVDTFRENSFHCFKNSFDLSPYRALTK